MKNFVYPVALSLAVGCAALVFAQPPAPAPGAAPAAGAAPGRGAGGAGRGGPVATPGATLAGQMLARADKDADQKLTKEELSALADAWFDLLDPDRTGKVSQEEFLQRFDSVTAAPGAAGGRGGRGGRGGGGGGGTGGTPLAFFTIVDENRDASVARAEMKGIFEKWPAGWDSNKDSRLDTEELAKGLNAVLPKNNMSGAQGRETMDPIPGLPKPPPSPVLSAQDSMATIKLVNGFKLELAASEPMIEDPIALSFDEDGRAYVVELYGYMLDIDRSREREPICRITRLEDTNGDGRFDKSSVFVDKLILPRAVAATSGGILYVSDYQLYFARDTDNDGKADQTELVDADYGRGNVEHAPNGLFRAMDNWIYNGESPNRYRIVNGTIVKQTTEQRGQWGMTQDNYGRLLYNVNNSQLLGDYTPSNYMSRNAHHPSSAGLNLFVASDQRAFPIRMTTAINRGYSPEVLSPEGKAFVFASSCAPMVYRGDNYPAEFVGNAFVCDPALNLIKRNLLSDQELTLSAKFAYEDREFLASTDERFRPSNLYNGPDGTLWVVDLYRGIAQYGQFMTAYLKRDTLERGLEKGIHLGRIYRIVSTAKAPSAVPQLSKDTPAQLVGRLASANGFTRDTAQRLLVERGDRSVAPALTQLVAGNGDPLARIHALWAIEGLFASLPESTPAPATKGGLRLQAAGANFMLTAAALPAATWEACLKAVADANPKVQVAAIRVSESLSNGNPARQTALLQALGRIQASAAEEALFQAALSAGNLPKPEALPVLVQVASRASNRLLVREAIVTGLHDWELQYLQLLLGTPQWTATAPGRPALIQALASAVIKEREPAKIDMLLTLAASQPAAQAWRKKSVLDGVASNTAIRPARPIAFNNSPTGLDALAKSADAPTREQAEAIKALFSWPGHQAEEAPKQEARALTANEATLVANGQTLFQQLCAGCHGLNGQGMVPMAPPLVNSDWVLGSERRLIRVLLHGVSGPITVNGTQYQPPNILPEMPGLGALDDNQLASVLSYIRRTWGHEAAPISPAQIATARAETQEQKTPWAAAQLLEVK